MILTWTVQLRLYSAAWVSTLLVGTADMFRGLGLEGSETANGAEHATEHTAPRPSISATNIEHRHEAQRAH